MSDNSFQNVINANGGLVTISGEILSIKPPYKNGPPKCQIKDSTGRVEEVGCWPPKPGKQGMIPSDALIGVMVNLYCSNKPYQGKNQFTGGILSVSQMAQKPNTIQQAYDEAKAAQDALQAPQNAPQSSNGREACIVRQNALAHAVKLLETSTPKAQLESYTLEQLTGNTINIAEILAQWALTGKKGDSPDNY